MTRKTIKQRERFLLAVEGESEQSFIRWIQQIADQMKLNIHLDCVTLNGGGYKSMLEKAENYRVHKEPCKSNILIVDADRAMTGDDGWSLDKLKKEAVKKKFEICLQYPNLEGIYVRMLMPEKGDTKLSRREVSRYLSSKWPEYKKPEDARAVSAKFVWQDLQRLALVDVELKNFLQLIEFTL